MPNGLGALSKATRWSSTVLKRRCNRDLASSSSLSGFSLYCGPIFGKLPFKVFRTESSASNRAMGSVACYLYALAPDITKASGELRTPGLFSWDPALVPQFWLPSKCPGQTRFGLCQSCKGQCKGGWIRHSAALRLHLRHRRFLHSAGCRSWASPESLR